ncbi:CDP-alcohol phosphatidyltransferase [Liquorilactobacillus nagelii DSM 13675]|nr:CDP-alcohol phosphatidyltransferase [Liquorilactobacillus nagelii DSM 13675]
MTHEKKRMAKNDYIAYYVGRKLSYILTVPFLYTKLTPNFISMLSMVPLIVGFYFFYVAKSSFLLIIGWLCLFLWNLIDGVDGNVARYRKQYSEIGSVFDATSGYLAMVVTFFAAGIAAAHVGGVLNFSFENNELYIIFGAISGIATIFPRLVMQKALATLKDDSSIDSVKDKGSFGPYKVIALNLSSVSGGAQFLLLLAILFRILNIYTIIYLLFNLIVAIVSLKDILGRN